MPPPYPPTCPRCGAKAALTHRAADRAVIAIQYACRTTGLALDHGEHFDGFDPRGEARWRRRLRFELKVSDPFFDASGPPATSEAPVARR